MKPKDNRPSAKYRQPARPAAETFDWDRAIAGFRKILKEVYGE